MWYGSGWQMEDDPLLLIWYKYFDRSNKRNICKGEVGEILMLLSPLVFCCSLRGFVVFYCAMTQYNTMLCLQNHSAILYKDVTYFRISLFSRIWFVNLIFIEISNY